MTFVSRSQIFILSPNFSTWRKGTYLPVSSWIAGKRWVRRHISGISETPLKNYDVTEFYSEILRCELRSIPGHIRWCLHPFSPVTLNSL